MIVRRVCSWCRTCYALVIWPDAPQHDTHGGCGPCVAKWKATYLTKKAT